MRRVAMFGRDAWCVGRLLLSRRTPLGLKLLLPLALVYALVPLDLVPDVVPLAGWADDIGVLLAAWWLLVQRGRRQVAEERSPQGRPRVVEGRYRLLDDEG